MLDYLYDRQPEMSDASLAHWAETFRKKDPKGATIIRFHQIKPELAMLANAAR